MWGASANRQGLLINDILQLSSLCRCSLLFACVFQPLKFALFLPAAPPHPSPVGKYPPPQFFSLISQCDGAGWLQGVAGGFEIVGSFR